MSAAKAPECIGIFYPKKGAWKYIGLPVMILLIISAINILLTVLIKSSDDEGTREFLKLQLFFASFGIPVAAAFSETVCEWAATARYAGKAPKRLMLLRTAPDMERVIKNAFVSDEIRRAGLCILTAVLSAAAMGLTGEYTSNVLVPAAVFAAGSMYFVLAVGVFLVRFIDNTLLMLFLVYIWLALGGGISMMLEDFILGGGEYGGPITLAFISGISAGIITCAAAVKRACACRHPDREK